MSTKLAFIVVICLLRLGSVFAQSGPTRFDVTSIKRSASNGRGQVLDANPSGSVRVTNMTLKELITTAWHLQPFQISGGPSWVDAEHFDISAKAENASVRNVPLMLQNLLIDRFSLEIHHEVKELPILALVLAKKNGIMGPGLVRTKDGSCTTLDPSQPLVLPDPKNRATLVCGMFNMQRTQLTGVGVPVSTLASWLSRHLNRTVVDKSGLSGDFDVNMDWTLEVRGADVSSDVSIPFPSDAGGASFASALRDQLGLSLQPQRGPVETLVIDGVKQPSEN